MDLITWLLFGIIATLTNVIEGVTGFGATVLGMPFVILLLGVEVAKPVLTLYALLLCLYFVIKDVKLIEWKHYLRMMVLLLLGLPIGILVYNYLPQEALLKILGVFMVLVAIRGLLITFNKISKDRQIKDWIALTLVFLGGIIHGAYASGGPLVIIYATEKIKDKSKFRATLCLIWVTLSTIILCQMAFASQITQEVVKVSIYGLPFLIIGTLLGNWAHHKLNQDLFMKLTYIILLTTGVFLLI